MKIGTKSVLFGAHAFYLHPWFVAWAWWKLYGFPWKPWLWVMFFVHDLGYWGKPNMDGPEGEEHPWLGARFLYRLQALWILLKQPVFFRKRYALCTDIRWWQLRRRWAHAYLGDQVGRGDLGQRLTLPQPLPVQAIRGTGPRCSALPTSSLFASPPLAPQGWPRRCRTPGPRSFDASDGERAAVSKARAEAVKVAVDAQVIDENEARAALDGDELFGGT